MGLDIGCNCGSVDFRAGSYSGFGGWREILAKMVNIDLDAMVGFGGSIPWTKKERFHYLLNHSDCENKITYRQCRVLLKDFSWLRIEMNRPKNLDDVWSSIFKTRRPDVDERWLERYEIWHRAIRHCVNDHCHLRFH